MGTTVKKLSNGYGYKYAELSTIHEELERQGMAYYQYTEFCPEANADYIYTVLIIDGEEQKPRRGCRVIYDTGGKMGVAQQQGSGVSYCRRYSLLMALGWATEDDDGKAAGKAPSDVTKPLKTASKLDFRQVREHLTEITTVDELNHYWQSLKLTDKQAEILKDDFTERKVKIGVGVGV